MFALRCAIGASLTTIVATSSGAAAAHVRKGFTKVRIGMFLESAATVGALTGATIGFSLAIFLMQRDYACIDASPVVLFVALFRLTREGTPTGLSEKFRMMCIASDTTLQFLNMMEAPGRNTR